MKKLQLVSQQNLERMKRQSYFAKQVFLVLFSVNWVLISVGEYLFTVRDYFSSSHQIQSLYNSQMITTAILFLTVSGLLGFSVRKIWISLRLIPELQRNQKIMWLHSVVVFLYSFFFITAAVIVSMAISGVYRIPPLLVAFNI